MDLSFIIATNRPYESHARRVIDSIVNAKNDLKHSFEIIVNTTLLDSTITKLYDNNKLVITKDENKKGAIAAFNEAVKIARGKYIQILPDDHTVSNNMFQVITLLNSNQRKYATLASGTICYINNIKLPNLPHYVMMRFPIINRDFLLDKLEGYVFHPNFYSHWADNYLSLYLGNNIETPTELDIRLSEFDHGNADLKFYEKDYQTMVELVNRNSNKYI